MRHLALLVLPIAMVVGAGCSSEPQPPETVLPAPAPAAPPSEGDNAATTPRVFFAEPADGMTLTSPVKMKFASEGVMIMPVPEGEVTTARPGVGHYHLAIDTDCLTAGTEIKTGEKWIHYSKGDTEADTQLSPGTHKLTLAIADDKHMQTEGLCKTITVTAR
jgi:hypothetical protein